MVTVSTARPAVSVIVPAYREAPNLRPLTERVFAATGQAGLDAELIVVDDNSQDGSVETVEELARRFPVRIVVRTQERGLSSAVLRGFEEAMGDVLVVMDADLQHPPEKIPELVECLTAGRADFALGSRYAGQGRIDRDWPLVRRLNSKVATLLAGSTPSATRSPSSCSSRPGAGGVSRCPSPSRTAPPGGASSPWPSNSATCGTCSGFIGSA